MNRMSQPQETVIARESLGLASPYVEPADAREKEIADIFAQVFRMDVVGAEDDFFDLGGDSLLGEEVSIAVSEVLDRQFPMAELLSFGTPRAIAEMARDGGAATAPSDRPPFFIVHGRGGYTVPRPEFVAGLGDGQRLVMFEVPGLRGEMPALHSVEEIAAHYVRKLEEAWPEGPILLAAFCTGGLIGVEMARQLGERGRGVASLVLIDPGAPVARLGTAARMRLKDGRTGSEARQRLARDFMALRVAARMHWERKSKDGRSRYGFVRRYPGLRIWPRARLLAAYRFHAPRPFEGRVEIISSADRAELYLADDGYWADALPERRVHALSMSHQELLQASAGGAAQLLKELHLARLEALRERL